MSDKNSPKQKNSPFNRLRNKLATSIISGLYGRKMHLSPFKNGTIAGVTIFWYMENNIRQFILVKDTKEKTNARFVSCLGTGKNANITEASAQTVRLLLGDIFFKALDRNLLGVDRVAGVPSFKCEDPVTGSFMPVHSVVWTVQITPEQAQLCEPKARNIEVLSVPEFALMSGEVASSHQQIYQSVLRHIHATQPLDRHAAYDPLEDLVSRSHGTQKIIH